MTSSLGIAVDSRPFAGQSSPNLPPLNMPPSTSSKKRPAEAPPAPSKKPKLSESREDTPLPKITYRLTDSGVEFESDDEESSFPLSLDPIPASEGPYHLVNLSFINEVPEAAPHIKGMGTWEDAKGNVHVVLVSDLLRISDEGIEETILYGCGNRTSAQNWKSQNPFKKTSGYRRKGH